jgi:hypothetical protein
LFALSIWIFDGDRERVLKYTFGVGERNPVLLEIRSCLRWVRPEPHASMIYTSYASRKRPFSEV